MSIIMPFGEAQSSNELKGTIFTVIPSGDIEDRETYDYTSFVKEDPESAAKCLERSMDLAAQFFDLYENMSTRIESLLSV